MLLARVHQNASPGSTLCENSSLVLPWCCFRIACQSSLLPQNLATLLHTGGKGGGGEEGLPTACMGQQWWIPGVRATPTSSLVFRSVRWKVRENRHRIPGQGAEGEKPRKWEINSNPPPAVPEAACSFSTGFRRLPTLPLPMGPPPTCSQLDLLSSSSFHGCVLRSPPYMCVCVWL